MPDYFAIQIGATHLTNDGLDTGIPCKVETSGISGLFRTRTGGVQFAADGTPYAFVTDHNGKGTQFSLSLAVIMDSEFNDIITEINALDPTLDTLPINIVGPPGDFTIEAIPLYPEWVVYDGEHIDDRLYGVVFNFVASSVVIS